MPKSREADNTSATVKVARGSAARYPTQGAGNADADVFMAFFNNGTGKCDFPVPSFSMTCSHRKWRYIPEAHTGR